MSTEFNRAPPPDPDLVAADVTRALAEDIGPGDLTALLIPADRIVQADLITREAGVLCGRAWFDACFQRLDPAASICWQAGEGATLTAGQRLCVLRGHARALLTGERAALNFLQLLSGVASRTRQYVDCVAGTAAKIVDTRKTLPGLRHAQKYAVRVGGGANHRFALWDAMLIKENHIAAAGSITAALAAVQKLAAQYPACRFVQVEVEDLLGMDEALDAGATMLLLDNFDLDMLSEAVRQNRARKTPAVLEASGGVTKATLAAIAQTGVDRISIGTLTKDIKALDLSMRFCAA
jgi:nicotinate-nucleotide pyrophosphorylase (carboxylating)